MDLVLVKTLDQLALVPEDCYPTNEQYKNWVSIVTEDGKDQSHVLFFQHSIADLLESPLEIITEFIM